MELVDYSGPGTYCVVPNGFDVTTETPAVVSLYDFFPNVPALPAFIFAAPGVCSTELGKLGVEVEIMDASENGVDDAFTILIP